MLNPANSKDPDRVRSTPGNYASEESARRIAQKAPSLRQRVLEHVRSCGEFGATNPELVEHFQGRDVTIWPRVSELKRLGYLEELAGVTRQNPQSGFACTVIVATSPERRRQLLKLAEERERPRLSGRISESAWEAAVEIDELRKLGALFYSLEQVARIIETAMHKAANQSQQAQKGDAKRASREGQP